MWCLPSFMQLSNPILFLYWFLCSVVRSVMEELALRELASTVEPLLRIMVGWGSLFYVFCALRNFYTNFTFTLLTFKKVALGAHLSYSVVLFDYLFSYYNNYLFCSLAFFLFLTKLSSGCSHIIYHLEKVISCH